LVSFQGCKEGSTYTNQPMKYSQKTEGQKIHDQLNRCTKSLWQNSTSLHDKIPEETNNRRNVPQHNKGYI
jgi:hypothetical protein